MSEGLRHILRMQHRRPLLPDGLPDGESGVIAPPPVTVIPPPASVGCEDKLRNRVGEEAVTALALAQGFFGLAMFGYVAKHHDGAARPLGGSEYRREAILDRHLSPTFRDQHAGVRQMAHDAMPQGRLYGKSHGEQRFFIDEVKHVVDGSPGGFFHGPPAQRLGNGVHVTDHLFFIRGHDAVANTAQRAGEPFPGCVQRTTNHGDHASDGHKQNQVNQRRSRFDAEGIGRRQKEIELRGWKRRA